jgi:uncharacterized protein (TIGR02444 family)
LNHPELRPAGSGNLKYDNDFWRFSLAVYGQNGVAEECLAMQEATGLDVNVLLFCAWTGVQSIVLSSADIEAASSSVAIWQDSVVRPLRSVRQYMKPLEDDVIGSLRARVKDLEIEAERVEQSILFAYSRGIQSPRSGADRRSATIQNVQKYIEMKSGPQPARSTELSAPLLVESALRWRS